MSRRPGIGHSYIEKNLRWHRQETVDLDGVVNTNLINYSMAEGILCRLPRYYKEKLFTDIEREKMAEENITISDDQYRQELERLTKLHSAPDYYYEERASFKHENVLSKINKTNTF